MDITRAIKGALLSFIFLVCFVYILSGIGGIREGFNKNVSAGSISEAVRKSTELPSTKPSGKLEIDALSAISVESNLLYPEQDRIIFGKDAKLKLPIASLTKLMTAVVVLDNYSAAKTIVIDKIADSQNPVVQDVKLGDELSVESLLQIMLVVSSNKAAYSLSEIMGLKAFVNLMNEKARLIGLENTSFTDPTGLSAQNISTAEDLVKFTKYILDKYPKIAAISKSREYFVSDFGKITNTDQLLAEVPDVVCSKTGFTNEARGCLLLVVSNPKNNNYLINVVLGAEDRFTEMRKLINWSSAICN